MYTKIFQVSLPNVFGQDDMLKQVSLEIDPTSEIAGLAERLDCNTELIECRNLGANKKGILIVASGERAKELIREVKKINGVSRVYNAKLATNKMLALIIVDKPFYCAVTEATGAFCLTCPFVSNLTREGWKMIVKDSETLRSTINAIEASGIKTKIISISSPFRDIKLTKRQRDVLLYVLKEGYFEFPRRKSLTKLASELSIKPSTLSEIIRRTEMKIVRQYLSSVLNA